MNRLLFLSLLFLAFTGYNFSQQAYKFDLFTAQIQNSKLLVKDNNGGNVYEKTFSNPRDYTVDLDGDSVDEYIVVDSSGSADLPSFTIYIFNTIDQFTLIDSIESGITGPYDTFSNEEGGEIIVTGNKDFEEFFNSNGDLFLPVNCWKYDSGQIFRINDDIYDLFISENDDIISYLDSFFENGNYDCNNINNFKSAIASVYANYISAGEVTLASQFIKKYYPCADVDVLMQKINEILDKGKSDENGME